MFCGIVSHIPNRCFKELWKVIQKLHPNFPTTFPRVDVHWYLAGNFSKVQIVICLSFVEICRLIWLLFTSTQPKLSFCNFFIKRNFSRLQAKGGTSCLKIVNKHLKKEVGGGTNSTKSNRRCNGCWSTTN